MFRRRSSASEPAQPPTGGSTSPTGPSDGTPEGRGGKGRPTPTRREAEAARRQRVRPRLDRRAAARARREQARADRLRVRKAMAEGDERHFLSRDRGAVRRFVRDYVDSRRTITEFFLPIILVVLVFSFIPVPEVQLLSTTLWLTSMLVVVGELFWLGFRLKRELRRRFPDDTGRGHVLYALARTTQMRRLRLPRPMVRPGAGSRPGR